ncbi:MAG TPA: tetratricopeptide repeat protein, partial [Candidatus Omnitrophota bacterium]|nr:tetratricopeptide repeat protein [Candidatus Omnitrophota bacterium]
WTNIHGFSFIGPLLILIFILSEAIKRSIKLPYQWNIEGKLQDRSLKDLVIVFFISIAATFLNPYGIEGASYPLTVLAQITGKGKIVFKYIQELARPITLKNIFNPNVFIFYKSFILISLFSFRFNQKNINVSNLILWLCFTVFSFFAIRNIAYFGIVAGFVCLENVESAIRNHKKLPFPLENPRFKMYSVYLFMAILFIYTGKGAFKYLESYTYIFDTYSLKSGMWGLTENKFPEKAVNFLLNCNIKGNMINDFNSGSYLIGRTYPMRQVFIDGRTELYGPVFFSDYVRLGEGERGIIEKTVAKYDIRGFFLTVSTDDLHTGLMRYLSKNPLWKVVYFDQTAIIFLKDIPENSKIIREFSIDLKRWKPAKPDLMKLGIVYRYPYPYVQRGRFLWRLGFFEAAAREAVEILAISPVNPDAYKFLSDYFYSKGNYNKAFQYARNCLVLASGDSYTRTRLALIYHKLGKDENALKVINAIIKNRPNYPEAFFVKAQIVKDKDINSAIEFLKTAIKFDGKEARYHNELGNLYEKKGEMEKAGEEWKRSFEYGGSRRDFKNN